MEFHTRPRMIVHLRDRSAVCQQYYMDNVTPMSIDEAELLDQADVNTAIAVNRRNGHSRDHTNGLTYYRIEGPLPIDFRNGRGNLKAGRRRAVAGDMSDLYA